jgi:hypothetical protein
MVSSPSVDAPLSQSWRLLVCPLPGFCALGCRCPSSPTTGRCLLADAAGWSSACCKTYNDCRSCIGQRSCGWCTSSGKCMHRFNVDGSPSASCDAKLWRQLDEDCCSLASNNASTCNSAPTWGNGDSSCAWFVCFDCLLAY